MAMQHMVTMQKQTHSYLWPGQWLYEWRISTWFQHLKYYAVFTLNAKRIYALRYWREFDHWIICVYSNYSCKTCQREGRAPYRDTNNVAVHHFFPTSAMAKITTIAALQAHLLLKSQIHRKSKRCHFLVHTFWAGGARRGHQKFKRSQATGEAQRMQVYTIWSRIVGMHRNL